MTSRNKSIDLMKFIAALMVIAIHTTRTFGTETAIGFLIINVVCRLAVPFFTVCSGYYIAAKQALNDNSSSYFKSIIGRQTKRNVKLYLVWTVAYLLFSIPRWISTGWFSPWAFVDYGIACVLSASHYHLWYLLSYIYALPLLFLISKYRKGRSFFPIILIIWFVKSITYGYISWMPTQVADLYHICNRFSSLYDAVFCILPLLLLGVEIQKQRVSYKLCICGTLVCSVLLCMEAFMLRHLGHAAVSFIFMTLPLVYFFFQVVMGMNIPVSSTVTDLLGKASVYIYCLHPMVGELSDNMIKSNGIHYLFTAIISCALCIAYILLRKRIKQTVH